jgi:hypothetical protein
MTFPTRPRCHHHARGGPAKMSRHKLWAKTSEQVDRVHEARKTGDMCSWCGRQPDHLEPVHVETMAVGRHRPYPTAAPHPSPPIDEYELRAHQTMTFVTPEHRNGPDQNTNTPVIRCANSSPQR